MIFIKKIVKCLIAVIGLLIIISNSISSFYYMKKLPMTLVVFIFSIVTILYLFVFFKKEFAFFINPNVNNFRRLFKIKHINTKSKVVVDSLKEYINKIDDFGINDIMKQIFFILSGLRITTIFFKPKSTFFINTDFYISAFLTVFIYIIFYIYKVNFVNNCRMLINLYEEKYIKKSHKH